MAIYRDNHREKGNFTQVSNTLIEDTRISSKSKLYLIFMLSRPDTWRFSIDGLLRFITEKKSALQSGLEELEKFGYLKRIKEHINGRISYYYEIHESPTAEQNIKPEKNSPAKKQHSEKQSTEKQGQKNSVQKTASHSNIDDTHTEINNTDLQKKKDKSESTRTQVTSLSKPKRKFGSYQNVPLTDEEYQNFCDYYGLQETNRSIESMSKYMAVNDKKYANTAVKLEQWIEEDIEKYGYVEPDKIPTQEEVKKMFQKVNEIMIARGWKTESTDTSASFPVPFPKPSGQLMAVRA